MNKTTTNRLLFIFLILLGIATIPLWSQYLDRVTPSQELNPFRLSRFTQQNVMEVIITRGEEATTLSVQEGTWKVNGEEADEQEITKLFESFDNAVIDSLASNNLDNHTKFGVTEENGVKLTIKQDKNETSYILGSTGPVFSSFYMKEKDQNAVYLVKGLLKDTLTQSVETWKKKEPTPEENSPEEGE